MAIRVISNPPNAGDWTRLKQDGDHIEHFVNDVAPATIVSPGGVIRPNMAKIIVDAQNQIAVIDTQARQYRDAALEAADAAGYPVSHFFEDKHEADDRIGEVSEGQYIEVQKDETADPPGSRVRYQRVSGVYEFRLNLDALRIDLAAGTATVTIIPEVVGGQPYTADYYLNLSTNWLDLFTTSERDNILNADPEDKIDHTAKLQAMLDDTSLRNIMPPPKSHRAQFSVTKLMLTPSAVGRTLAFEEMTFVQRSAQTGTGLSSGLFYPTFAADTPAFGGFDDLRIVGGRFVQTAEVHDALVKLMYGRRSRYEGMIAVLRDSMWTPMVADHTTDTFTGTHSFVDGDYVLCTFITVGGSRPTGIGAGSYKVLNAVAGVSLQLTSDGINPVAFSSNGTGSLVIANYGAWAFKIGGDDCRFDLSVEATGSPAIYQDGIHVVHGRRSQIKGTVHCGDDAFVAGQEYSNPDCTDRVIEDWLIEGTANSEMGSLARAYCTDASQTVKGLTFRAAGLSGRYRNGVVSVVDATAIDARSATPHIDGITFEIDGAYGESTHQGINPYAIDIRSGANVKVAGSIRQLGSSLLSGGQINLSTADISKVAMGDIGASLVCYRSEVLAHDLRIKSGSSDLITVQEGSFTAVGGFSLKGVPEGKAAIKQLAGTSFPAKIVARAGEISHGSSVLLGSAIDVSASAFVAGQVDSIEASGLDLRSAAGAILLGAGSALLGENNVRGAIRNPEATGQVAGSPGTLPTRWAAPANGAAGLTRSILSVGKVAGHTALAVRMAGTTSSAAGFDVMPTTIGDQPALPGQRWAFTLTAALLSEGAGLTNVTSVKLVILEQSAAGTTLVTHASAAITLRSISQELSFTSAVFAHASTGRVAAALRFEISNGVAVDVAVAVASPRLYRA